MKIRDIYYGKYYSNLHEHDDLWKPLISTIYENRKIFEKSSKNLRDGITYF